MPVIEETNIFKKEIKVASYECNPINQMKLSYVLRHFQEISGDHYEEHGYPYEYMVEKSQVYLLSKMNFQMEKMPLGWQQTNNITWEEGTKGAEFIRDYQLVKPGEKKPLIQCRSYWVLVDFQSHKIIRPSQSTYKTYFISKSVEVKQPKKILAPENKELAYIHRVLYRDLDRYHHMNNAVYGDIVSSILPMDWEKQYISDFSIFFNHEALLGEDIEIFTGKTEDGGMYAGGYKKGLSCFESLSYIQPLKEIKMQV